MSDALDFSKLDPLIRDYITEMREAMRKSKAEAKELGLERDAYKAELDDLKKAQQLRNQPARSVRDMAGKEYRQAVRDMRKDLRAKDIDEKLARFPSDTKDVKSLTPEQYKEWKLKATGRKAW